MYKKILAILLMLLLIVGAVFLGTWRSLSSMKRAVDKVFADGVDADGYGIQDDLDIIAEQSWNLITVARNYYPDSDENLAALITAHASLTSAVGVGEKSDANTALSQAVTTLYEQLKSEASLTEANTKVIGQYYTEIQSRNQTIRNNGYNDAARHFNEQCGGFPAAFIAPLVGISLAELFE